MENIERIAEMAFHGITYIIEIATRDDILHIKVEQKDNGDTWKNTFTANYIEEISQKTGNYKKFPVFVKMLLSSISKNSDAVFLDILTFQDLQMIKDRKQKTNTSMNTTQDKTKNNKRYMILTYSVEYDKVHYPLPLNYDENPDVMTLQNTIRRLRMEMEELKTNQTKVTNSNDGFFMTQEIGGDNTKSSSDLLLLKVENENLKEKLKRFEESSAANTKRVGAVQHEMELKSKMEIETELENLKKEYVRDVKRLKAKVDETEIQLEKTKEELSRAGGHGLDGSGRKLNKDEELELVQAKKLAARYQSENEQITQELEGFKDLDRKQKVRIKQLETDLAAALSRVNYSRGSNQAGGSPYNRSRGSSPGNSASKRYNSTPTYNSPGPRAADKKGTPVRGRTNMATPSPKGTPTRGTPKTYGYGGTSSNRNSPMTKTATAPNPIVNKRTTPQRTTPQRTTNSRDTYGSGNKRSPQPMRNLSPSNTKPNTYSPSNSRLSPGNNNNNNKFGMRTNNYVGGGNLQRRDLENSSLRNRSKNSNLTDSGDEASYQRSKNQSLNSILSSNRNVKSNAYQNNIATMQQKLKENVHDYKESKGSKGPEKPAQQMPEAAPEMNDIGDRLNKLQDLLKRAKS